ncbi:MULTISPECIES: DUF6236 family protein [Shewanella]|uniref:Uncharacterized protein n=1 Tax=Shewanella bicestrii TaxID=2018305 RepID=A0A220UQP9_9GAMM|nr:MULTISPECIES: DUF6236 family protein [Shewanella]ASK70226.1 hypothetical protein CF168_15995 [Shewanella bicestrii]MCD8560084.1 DUF6236 family protein [Shewanella xiamenensis]MDI5835924.1 DUF6236 family protein [Shewanella xiamenensis]MDI5839670.1 DUF6236 family protein [Shewanella xiamenensis]MDI5843437.1 DUF6236 family protein [Shewanella xiamenensis]
MIPRGLMITQNIDANSSGFTLNGGIDAQNLRQYLLFWDHLVCPQSNLFHFGMGQDFEYLMNAGVAQYVGVNFSGRTNAGSAFWRALEDKAFEQLLTDKNIEWSLASNIRILELNTLKESKQEALCFSLIDALKVFTPEVPLPEILEFKQKRQNMLLELRDSIDELKDSICVSQNSLEALQRKKRKVEKDITELNQLIDETKFPSIRRCAVDVLTVEGVVGFTSAMLTEIGIGNGYGLALKGLSVMGGIGFSMMKCNRPVKLPSHLKQYAYVACAKQELI